MPAYTENDVFENIENGNVYLKPNIEAELAFIVDGDYGLNIIYGTMNVLLTLAHEPTENIIYFKDDSYLRCELNPTWSSGVPSIVTNIAFNAYLGINDGEGNIDEVYVAGAGGLPGSFQKYIWVADPLPLDPDHGSWEPSELLLYQPGDTFMFSIGWWNSADPKFSSMFVVQTAGSGSYNIADYNSLPNGAPIFEGGLQAGIQLQTVDGQKIASFFCGSTSEGTQYPGDDSETGGGSGTFYNRNDAIDFTPLPSLQAIDFGFTSLYNPSPADMRAICQWLWSDSFTNNIKKNYMSPFENILGFNFIALPENTLSIENGKLAISHFVVGNADSEVQTLRITSGNQYLDLNCGDVIVPEYWQNFLDYNTNFSIWLPYIGFRQLKPDDILQATEHTGGKLSVIYHIDLLTGCAVCEIRSIIPDRATGELVPHVLYNFNTNVFYSTPISGANFMSMYNQQLSASISGVNNLVSSVSQIAKGDIVGGAVSLLTGQAQAKRDYETAKPDYGRSGSSGGNSGYFSYKRPYIVRTQPIGQTPKNYKSLIGIPSQKYYILNELSGYTEVDSVVVDTLSHCTDDEKNTIITLLKNGIIL